MREIIETDVPKIQRLLIDVLDEHDYRHIERMGGLTNHTYKVILHDGRIYVIRLPGEGTEELINRKDESVSTQLACRLGIDAQLLYFGEHGEKISCYIEQAQTMCASDFCSDNTLKKAAEIFRTLHASGVDTKVAFDVLDKAAGYEKIIKDNAVELFDDYAEIKAKIFRIRNYVESITDISLVPCHNDPLCENWVMGKDGKLYLIDWEYAGMNDGMWDLADLSIEARLSDIQDETLMRYYLHREPKHEERIRFYANKLYLDFLWALWGKARVPFDGESMEEYGQARYARLKNNLSLFLRLFPIDG